MYKGKLITDEVAAEGLLLQSQDTFPFKEHLLERCKKYNCAEILDTYVADPAELSQEFRNRLRGADTPKKAMDELKEGEKEKLPVANAIHQDDLYVFTSSDLKSVGNKSVFITRDGYLESEASASMREGMMAYLRTSVQGGFFEHVFTRLEAKDDVAKFFQLLLKESTTLHDMALFNAHLAFADIKLENRNISDLYTKLVKQAKIVKDLAELQKPPSTWVIHPKQLLMFLVKETMIKDVHYRAMAETSGLVEKLCTGNTLTALEFVTAIIEKEKFYEQMQNKQGIKGNASASYANPGEKDISKISANPSKAACFNWEDNGQCEYGDKCKFAHTSSKITSTASNESGKVNPKRTSETKPSGKEKPVCNNCGATGHKAPKCNEAPATCEYCGKQYHLKRFCMLHKADLRLKALQSKETSQNRDEPKHGPAAHLAQVDINGASNQEWDNSNTEADLWVVDEFSDIKGIEPLYQGAAQMAVEIEEHSAIILQNIGDEQGEQNSNSSNCDVTKTHQGEFFAETNLIEQSGSIAILEGSAKIANKKNPEKGHFNDIKSDSHRSPKVKYSLSERRLMEIAARPQLQGINRLDKFGRIASGPQLRNRSHHLNRKQRRNWPPVVFDFTYKVLYTPIGKAHIYVRHDHNGRLVEAQPNKLEAHKSYHFRNSMVWESNCQQPTVEEQEKAMIIRASRNQEWPESIGNFRYTPSYGYIRRDIDGVIVERQTDIDICRARTEELKEIEELSTATDEYEYDDNSANPFSFIKENFYSPSIPDTSITGRTNSISNTSSKTITVQVIDNGFKMGNENMDSDFNWTQDAKNFTANMARTMRAKRKKEIKRRLFTGSRPTTPTSEPEDCMYRSSNEMSSEFQNENKEPEVIEIDDGDSEIQGDKERNTNSMNPATVEVEGKQLDNESIWTNDPVETYISALKYSEIQAEHDHTEECLSNVLTHHTMCNPCNERYSNQTKNREVELASDVKRQLDCEFTLTQLLRKAATLHRITPVTAATNPSICNKCEDRIDPISNSICDACGRLKIIAPQLWWRMSPETKPDQLTLETVLLCSNHGGNEDTPEGNYCIECAKQAISNLPDSSECQSQSILYGDENQIPTRICKCSQTTTDKPLHREVYECPRCTWKHGMHCAGTECWHNSSNIMCVIDYITWVTNCGHSQIVNCYKILIATMCACHRSWDQHWKLVVCSKTYRAQSTR